MNSGITQNAPQTMAQESIDSLLLYISCREEDENMAKEAMVEALSRFNGYFCTIFENLIEGRANRGAQLNVDELRNSLVLQLWKKAGTFSPPAGIPPEDLDKLFLGWVGKIAKNIFLDEITQLGDEFTQDDLYWETESSVSFDEEPISKQLSEALQEALEMLNDKESVVILTTMECGGKFESSDVENLAKRLEVTPATLRKIRERAYAKMRKFLEEKGISLSTNIYE